MDERERPSHSEPEGNLSAHKGMGVSAAKRELSRQYTAGRQEHGLILQLCASDKLR